jgi:hypothetical protein
MTYLTRPEASRESPRPFSAPVQARRVGRRRCQADFLEVAASAFALRACAPMPLLFVGWGRSGGYRHEPGARQDRFSDV